MLGFSVPGWYGYNKLGRHLYFDHGIKKAERQKWMAIAPHSHVACIGVTTAEDFYEYVKHIRSILRCGGMNMRINRKNIFHNEKHCPISKAPTCVHRFGQNTICQYIVKNCRSRNSQSEDKLVESERHNDCKGTSGMALRP